MGDRSSECASNAHVAPLATVGSQVGNTIDVPAANTTVSGQSILAVTLDPSEQFTLPAATGGAGYVMEIGLLDTSLGSAFSWLHSNTGTDLYSGGHYRRDDGDQTSTRDFGLAIAAPTAATPEPASLGLRAIGAAGLLLRRRRA